MEDNCTFLSDCKKNVNNLELYDIGPCSPIALNESDDGTHCSQLVRQTKMQYIEENELIARLDNSFVCLICKKIFTLRKNCLRHLSNIHSKQITLKKRKKTTQEQRKYLLFGKRIYSKPTAWLRVQCKLCCTTLRTCKELRQHLRNHSDVDTLHMLELSGNIVQYLYPNMSDLNLIKESICEDIREKRWSKFYSVLNKYSYEMSISDTEEEDVELEEEAKELTRKYKCSFCVERFSFKFQAFQHLEEVHNDTKINIKCGQCKLSFVSIKMYNQHQKTHCDNKYKVLLCEHCPGKFMWPENIKNHNCLTIRQSSSQATSKDQLKHDINQWDYHLETEYEEHSQSLSTTDVANSSNLTAFKQLTPKTESKFVCSFCCVSFSDNLKLIAHITTQHMDNKWAKCSHCEMAFTNAIYLHSHRLTHNAKKHRYQCVICDKCFSSTDQLNNHKRTHKTESVNKCIICRKSFKSPDDLNQHLDTHTNDKPHNCDICGKIFLCKSDLQQHRLALGHNNICTTIESTSGTTVLEKVDKYTEERKKQSLCSICGIYLSKNTSLTQHLKTHSGEKPHKCDLCERSFLRKTGLRHHRRVHTQERPYKCQHCVKSFPVQSKLKSHMRIHTGERPYQCTFCSKTFYNCSNFKLHLRSHTGERPFKCEICDQLFADRAYLKKHRKVKGH